MKRSTDRSGPAVSDIPDAGLEHGAFPPSWARRCGHLAFLGLLLLLAASLAMLPGPACGQATRVGGPCAYSDYPGTAMIVSVEPVPPSANTSADSPYQPYRVRFTFAPAEPVPHRLYARGKVHELTLSGGTSPGPRFLEKYAITPGAAFAAKLHLIDSGTCSPVAFTFTGIDVSDHFELKKR